MSINASTHTEMLTLAEAAALAGRSYSWARDRAADGRLDARRFSANGKIHVTAASLAAAVKGRRDASQKRVIKRRGHLRLAWVNPNP